MNERDYHIAEAMVLSAGALVSVSVAAVFLIYSLPISLALILSLSFIWFISFTLGLYCHMKRRIFILENEEIIKIHKQNGEGK